ESQRIQNRIDVSLHSVLFGHIWRAIELRCVTISKVCASMLIAKGIGFVAVRYVRKSAREIAGAALPHHSYELRPGSAYETSVSPSLSEVSITLVFPCWLRSHAPSSSVSFDSAERIAN